MKITRFQPSVKQPDSEFDKDLEQSLDKMFSRLFDMLNSGLSFTDNFDVYITTITTNATPGNETVIAHGLKRIPSGFLIIERDKAAHIYTGSTAKTAENYYIKSDVATVTTSLIIF